MIFLEDTHIDLSTYGKCMGIVDPFENMKILILAHSKKNIPAIFNYYSIKIKTVNIIGDKGIELEDTCSNISYVFRTIFHKYKTEEFEFFGNIWPAAIPKLIAQHIVSIIGLENFHEFSFGGISSNILSKKNSFPRKRVLKLGLFNDILSDFSEKNVEKYFFKKEPAEQTPAEQIPAVEEPAVEEPAEQIPVVKIPAVQTPAVKIPAVEEPGEKIPADQEPAEQIPAVEEPVVEEPAEKILAVEEPTEQISAEKIPAEKIPAVEEPAEQILAVEEPAEQIPAVQIPAEQIPAVKEPAKQTLADQEPVEQIPAVEEPTEQIPAVQIPAEQIPAVEEPAEQIPAVQIPAVEEPAEQMPAVQIPAEQIPAVEEPAEQIPAVQIPAEQITAVEEPAVEERAVKERAVKEPAVEELAEIIPSETIPAVVEPAETIPAETIPAVEEPAETISAEIIPAETIPSMVAIGTNTPKLMEIRNQKKENLAESEPVEVIEARYEEKNLTEISNKNDKANRTEGTNRKTANPGGTKASIEKSESDTEIQKNQNAAMSTVVPSNGPYLVPNNIRISGSNFSSPLYIYIEGEFEESIRARVISSSLATCTIPIRKSPETINIGVLNSSADKLKFTCNDFTPVISSVLPKLVKQMKKNQRIIISGLYLGFVTLVQIGEFSIFSFEKSHREIELIMPEVSKTGPMKISVTNSVGTRVALGLLCVIP